MRQINSQLLKMLVRAQGEKGTAKVALGADVSLSGLQKMMAGTYTHVPREAMQRRLCDFFHVSQDDLFPLVGASKKEAS